MAVTITNDAALKLIAEGQADIAAGSAKVAQGHAALSANLAPPVVVEPPKPEPPTAGPLTKVASLTALTAALKAAKAGEIIELAAGEYGAYSLKGLIAPGVTVRAAGAKVTGLVLAACEGIAFEDLAADLSSGGRVLIDGCKHIDLVRMTSRNATLYGVSIQRSEGVQVISGDFADVKDGVHLLNSRDVLVGGNKIRRFRADGVNMSGVTNVRVVCNDIAECLAGPTGHPDGVQLQTTGAEVPSEGIEVIGNKMRRGGGAAYQGVFLTVQAGGQRHRGIVVADNDIEGGLFNGIMVASADNVSVTGNRVQPYEGQNSWIRVENCTDVLLERNAYAEMILKDVTGLDRRDKATLSAISAR